MLLQFAFLNWGFRWVGLALITLGFSLDALHAPNYASLLDGVGLLVQVLVLAGLLLIICSRERVEDELINHYRLMALQWSVILLILLRLSWKSIGYFTSDESWMPSWQVNSMLWFYLFFFYYQCYLREWIINLIKPDREK